MQQAIVAVCPVHGRVRCEYNRQCFWWECPEMVECGFNVTREAVQRHPDGEV